MSRWEAYARAIVASCFALCLYRDASTSTGYFMPILPAHCETPSVTSISASFPAINSDQRDTASSNTGQHNSVQRGEVTRNASQPLSDLSVSSQLSTVTLDGASRVSSLQPLPSDQRPATSGVAVLHRIGVADDAAYLETRATAKSESVEGSVKNLSNCLVAQQLELKNHGASESLWLAANQLLETVRRIPQTGSVKEAVATLLASLVSLKVDIALRGGRDALCAGECMGMLTCCDWINSARLDLWKGAQNHQLKTDVNNRIAELDALREAIQARRPFLQYLTTSTAVEQNTSRSPFGYSSWPSEQDSITVGHGDDAENNQLRKDVLKLQSEVMNLSLSLVQASTMDLAAVESVLASGTILQHELACMQNNESSLDIGLPLEEDDSCGSDGSSDFQKEFFEHLEMQLTDTCREFREIYASKEAEAIFDEVRQLHEVDALDDLGDPQELKQLLNCAQMIHRSQTSSALNYTIEKRLADISRMIDEALSVRERDAQLTVHALLESALDECPIADIDRERIDESLALLNCLTKRWGKSERPNAQELVNLAQNGVVLFQGLSKQVKQVRQARHLNEIEKSQVISWLCRLAENESALLADDANAAVQFVSATDKVVSALSLNANSGKRLVAYMQSAAEDRTCTDWASTVLVELCAMIDSTRLERDLAQLAAHAQNDQARYNTALYFASKRTTHILPLLRFSAFKAFVTESEHAKVGHKEAVEQALYLYTKLQHEFDLPGSVIAERMDYAEHAEKLFGKNNLEEAMIQAREAIVLTESGGANHKKLLLENLEVFGVKIWSDLLDLLPRVVLSAVDKAALETNNTQLQETMTTLEALDIEASGYEENVEKLNAQYHQLLAHRETLVQENSPDPKAVDVLLSVLH